MTQPTPGTAEHLYQQLAGPGAAAWDSLTDDRRAFWERQADEIKQILERQIENEQTELQQLRARVTELEAERKKYVGAEPTIAEEMAYLGRCLNTFHDLCDLAKQRDRATVTVAELEMSLDLEWESPAPRPALPWAHTMDDHDLHLFLDDLVSAALGRWQSAPNIPDREVLAAVEQACANWRTPGQGLRSDEPGTGDER